MHLNPDLSRQAMSWQGNRGEPGLRWFKYREAFSADFVRAQLQSAGKRCRVLDPFAGVGTATLTAASMGLDATGIELLPVGRTVSGAIRDIAEGIVTYQDIMYIGRELRWAIDDGPDFDFPHTTLTRGAFAENEQAVGRALGYAVECRRKLRNVVNTACMAVLEDCSHTIKDGQYMRWFAGAERETKSKRFKKTVLDFREAVDRKLWAMATDRREVVRLFGHGEHSMLDDSCLQGLADMADGTFDMVITSPPYLNRYDYIRTYALELAWLGFGDAEMKAYRQEMLSSTVENKPKTVMLASVYTVDETAAAVWRKANEAFSGCFAVQEIHAVLSQDEDLPNKAVLGMISSYFFEMALVITEMARVLRPGGRVVMVNDNVQYSGEEVPVDVMLSYMAERVGFRCERIDVLPGGKGNSSQQMAKYGKRELRKCVLHWEKR